MSQPRLARRARAGVRMVAAALLLQSVASAAAGQMAPGPTGLLAIEIDTSDTRVIVDGIDMGPAAFPGQPPRALPLLSGAHHVTLARPGSAPVDLTVDIVPGQTSVIRWQPSPAARDAGDGYQVIPPRATAPERPPEGGGYFVVPKP